MPGASHPSRKNPLEILDVLGESLPTNKLSGEGGPITGTVRAWDHGGAPPGGLNFPLPNRCKDLTKQLPPLSNLFPRGLIYLLAR